MYERFKDTNDGKKMEVWAVMSENYNYPTLGLLNNEWPMPYVKKDSCA